MLDISAICPDPTIFVPRSTKLFQRPDAQRQAIVAKVYLGMHRIIASMGGKLEKSTRPVGGRVQTVLKVVDRRQPPFSVVQALYDIGNFRLSSARSLQSGKSALASVRQMMLVGGFHLLPRERSTNCEQIMIVDPSMFTIEKIRSVWPEFDAILHNHDHPLWGESITACQAMFTNQPVHSLQVMGKPDDGLLAGSMDETDDEETVPMPAPTAEVPPVTPDFNLSEYMEMPDHDIFDMTTLTPNFASAQTKGVAVEQDGQGDDYGYPFTTKSATVATVGRKKVPAGKRLAAEASGPAYSKVMKKLFEERFPNISKVPQDELEEFLEYVQ
jgi:hypothetical protein